MVVGVFCRSFLRCALVVAGIQRELVDDNLKDKGAGHADGGHKQGENQYAGKLAGLPFEKGEKFEKTAPGVIAWLKRGGLLEGDEIACPLGKESLGRQAQFPFGGIADEKPAVLIAEDDNVVEHRLFRHRMDDKGEGDLALFDALQQFLWGAGQGLGIQADLLGAVYQAVEVGSRFVGFGELSVFGNGMVQPIVSCNHGEASCPAVALVVLLSDLMKHMIDKRLTLTIPELAPCTSLWVSNNHKFFSLPVYKLNNVD